MPSVSLTTLRALARAKADMPVAGFIPDSATGIDAYINEGISILHGKLIGCYGSEYSEGTSSGTTSGAAAQALPADFFKLYGVDMNNQTLMPVERNERNAYRNAVSMNSGRTRYKLTGTANITFYPTPPAGTAYTLYYAPTCSVLTAPSDTVTFPNGWERYVVFYTAIQMKLKQEDDVRDLRVELEKMDAELRELMEQRDASFAHHATDVELLEVDPRFW